MHFTPNPFRFLAGLVQWPKPGKLGSYITLGLALARYTSRTSWFWDFHQFVADLCSSRSSWYAMFVRMIVDWLMCTWLLTLPTSSSWHYSGKLYIFLCIINMLLCSISNGYVGSICMMSAPQVKQWSFGTCASAQMYDISTKSLVQTVRSEEGQTAASLMVALLGLGLGTGAFLSNYFVMLI